MGIVESLQRSKNAEDWWKEESCLRTLIPLVSLVLAHREFLPYYFERAQSLEYVRVEYFSAERVVEELLREGYMASGEEEKTMKTTWMGA